MLKRVACAILLSVGFHAPPAFAGIYLSGNDLFSDCSVPKDNPVFYSRSERCTGFITGVVDTTEGMRSLQNQPYCIPSDVTLGQLNGAVVAYLNAHAEMRSVAASALVIAWPVPTETYFRLYCGYMALKPGMITASRRPESVGVVH